MTKKWNQFSNSNILDSFDHMMLFPAKNFQLSYIAFLLYYHHLCHYHYLYEQYYDDCHHYHHPTSNFMCTYCMTGTGLGTSMHCL